MSLIWGPFRLMENGPGSDGVLQGPAAGMPPCSGGEEPGAPIQEAVFGSTDGSVQETPSRFTISYGVVTPAVVCPVSGLMGMPRTLTPKSPEPFPPPFQTAKRTTPENLSLGLNPICSRP